MFACDPHLRIAADGCKAFTLCIIARTRLSRVGPLRRARGARTRAPPVMVNEELADADGFGTLPAYGYASYSKG